MTPHVPAARRHSRLPQRLIILLVLAAALLALLPQAALATPPPEGPAVRLGDLSSETYDLAAVGGKVVYANRTDDFGAEPWCADAVTGTAYLVKDINPGIPSSFPEYFLPAGDYAYFTVAGGTTALWRTDCTADGTVRVGLFPTSISGRGLGLADGRLVFTAFDYSSGVELWVSDGTEAGTVLVKDILPGGSSSAPSDYLQVGNKVYFVADDGEHGGELWVTDGTEAGTHLVKDITVGHNGSYILGMAAMHDTAYFLAYSGGVSIELWRSDGTAEGTQPVAPLMDIYQAWLWYGDLAFTQCVGDTLYIEYIDLVNGMQVWRSDGITAGTYKVQQLSSGDGRMVIWDTGEPRDTLYYPGYTVEAGTELWRTDGTATGSWMVKDINPGAANGAPTEFLRARDSGLWLFPATSAGTGSELWYTDGTTAGTKLWQDIVPGEGSGNPQYLTKAGSFVYFIAGSAANGWDVWATRVDPPTDGPVRYFPAIRR